MLACNLLLWSKPTSSNTHSFANSDTLPLIHEIWRISTKVLASAMKMLIGLGSCSSQHDRTQRDLLPSAEVLVCEHTIQKQTNLKIKKIWRWYITYALHLSLSCHRLEFRHAVSKRCVSTIAHYPSQDHHKHTHRTCKTLISPVPSCGYQVWTSHQKNG